MRKRIFHILAFVFMFFLGSCTIATTPQPSATLPPAISTAPYATQPGSTSGSSAPAKIPVTWSALQLSGKLIYVVSASDSAGNLVMQVQQLDLGTGSVTTIFQTPPNGYIDSAVISPDQKTLLMSYAPPDAQSGSNFYPLTLFSMPLDGSQAPQQLFPVPLSGDQDIQPVWSPDGKAIYFVLVNNAVPPADQNQHYPIDQIYRAAYPSGQPEKILDKAYWPRLAADGSNLIYVSENPEDGTNKLFVASPDGSNPHQIILTGAKAPSIIDAPIFLPDGKTILFSAPTPAQSSTSPWLDWLLGVTQVSAHNIPSEWWSAPAGGGPVMQLTYIQAASLYACISPDKRMLASFSGDGLFVMKPDGSNLTILVTGTGGNSGTVNWIP
jgi:Tol biopolymer transport system component